MVPRFWAARARYCYILPSNADHHEHELVLSAMDGLEPTRKCFRLVGGVLVERTVAEVHPAVDSNKEKIKSVIESLRY